MHGRSARLTDIQSQGGLITTRPRHLSETASGLRASGSMCGDARTPASIGWAAKEVPANRTSLAVAIDRVVLAVLEGPSCFDDAPGLDLIARLPAGQPQRADHFIGTVWSAAGEHDATAGGRRVAPGVEHARLMD